MSRSANLAVSSPVVYYHDDSLFLTRLLMALTSHHASWERTIIISFPGNARRHPLNNLQFSSVETRSSSPRATTTAHDPPSPRTSKKGFAANTDRGKCEPTPESESSTLPPGVEMAGIEPASLKGEPGLLRAQLTSRSTQPLHSRQQVAAGPSRSEVPNDPCDAGRPASLLE